MSSTSARVACNGNQCALMNNSLLTWDDQKKSGGVFAVGLVSLYLLKNYTLLGLISYTLLYATVLCSSWVLVKNVMVAFQNNQTGEAPAAQPHPFQKVLDFVPAKVNFREDQTVKMAKKLTSVLNKFVTCVVDLVLAKSISASLGFAAVLYLSSGIFARFEFLTLSMLIWNLLFSVPAVYKLKKTEIDGIILKVWEPVEPHVTKIQGMIMKYKNASKSVAQQEKDE